MTTFIESDVEEAALGWLRGLGWQTAYGPDIGPDSPKAERENYGPAVLERRLQDALARLNPSLPVSALDDALRKLTRPEGATLEVRNRSFHRMLVNGVTVEYRAIDSSIRGEQAQVIDFPRPGDQRLAGSRPVHHHRKSLYLPPRYCAVPLVPSGGVVFSTSRRSQTGYNMALHN